MICKRALWHWRDIVAATAAGLAVLSVAGRCGASPPDCADAVCRIAAADGSCGSGCVFEIDGQWVYVLTAAHVVGNDAAVQCEFWRDGHKSEGLAGQVSRRNADVDAAVVAVPAASLGGVLPSAIPLAPRGTAVQAGQTLVSIGCANGAWATGWKGHAVPGDADELRFVPSPANGRSGSPILDAEGSHIVGILVARTMDNAEGIGVPIAAVYRAFDAKKSRVEREELKAGHSDSQPSPLNSQLLTQCGPNGCPNCPQRKYVVPHLFGNASPNQGGPWPSLTPPAPSVNLTPLDEKLGRIAGLLEEMRRPAAPPGSDPATAEMLQRHGQAIDQLRADVPKQINAAVEPVAEAVKKFGKSVEETNENIATHGTLMERLAADKAKVAAEEPGASKAKQDVDALKLEISQHKAIFLTILAVGVVALLGVHTYLQKSGQPDPIQTAVNALTAKVDAAAAANPALAPLAAGQNAVNGLVNQLAGQVAGLQQQVAAVQQQATAQSGQIAAVATAVPPPAATAAAPATTAVPKPAGT